jgi:hypothetical protein
LIAALAGLAAGCNQNGGATNNVADASNVAAAPAPVATLPLTDAPATTALAAAPPPTQLPAYGIRRARIANPQDQYAFIERANRARYGFGDAPPDYAYNYDGASPWAWQANDGNYMITEPIPGGGDRYYYYAPGQDAPYYVSDPDYGYGYQDGVLVVVYDRHGRPLPYGDNGPYWDWGGRYWLRGQGLWRGARGPHYGVPQAYWNQRRDAYENYDRTWNQQIAANPAWNAYNSQYGPQYNQQMQQERWRREAEAYRYDQSYNDGARAQREHDEALAAVGVAGVAGGVIAGGLFGHHNGPPPMQGQFQGPQGQFRGPQGQFQGARPPGPFGGPSQAPLGAPGGGPAAQRMAAAQAAQQASAHNLMAARQAEAQAQAQHQALIAQQQQLAAQHAQMQAQARAAANAQQAAQARAQTQAIEQQQAALRARQAAAAQQAAQAHQGQILAARQAQFRAQEAQVAQFQAQKEAAAAQRAQQAAAAVQARQAQAAQAHQAQMQAAQARAAHVQAQEQAGREAQAQQQAAHQAQVVAAQHTQATQAAAAARARAAEEAAGRRPEGRPQPQ